MGSVDAKLPVPYGAPHAAAGRGKGLNAVEQRRRGAQQPPEPHWPRFASKTLCGATLRHVIDAPRNPPDSWGVVFSAVAAFGEIPGHCPLSNCHRRCSRLERGGCAGNPCRGDSARDFARQWSRSDAASRRRQPVLDHGYFVRRFGGRGTGLDRCRRRRARLDRVGRQKQPVAAKSSGRARGRRSRSSHRRGAVAGYVV